MFRQNKKFEESRKLEELSLTLQKLHQAVHSRFWKVTVFTALILLLCRFIDIFLNETCLINENSQKRKKNHVQ